MKLVMLGVDYGKSRIGLAEANDVARLATPLPPASQDNISQRFEDFYQDNPELGLVVVGMPNDQNDTATQWGEQVSNWIEQRLRPMIMRLDKAIKIEVQTEYGSSARAKQILINEGKDNVAFVRDGKIDSYSAAVILQDYIDDNNN